MKAEYIGQAAGPIEVTYKFQMTATGISDEVITQDALARLSERVALALQDEYIVDPVSILSLELEAFPLDAEGNVVPDDELEKAIRRGEPKAPRRRSRY